MLNKLSYNLANSLNESESDSIEVKKTVLIESDGIKTEETKLDESGSGIVYLDKLISGEEVYFRDVDGQALLIKYADNYPEPEEHDEGYLEVNGGTPEELARAKEAAENREVWEMLEIDESTLEPNGTHAGYIYGQVELESILSGLKQVNVKKSLEESDTNNMTMEEMIQEYSRICEESGISIFEVVDQLYKYDVLNTGSFRNMLQELKDYIEDNK